VPGEVSAHYAQQVSRASAAEAQWTQAFASYSAQHPELAAQFTRRMKGELPDEEQWAAKLPANPAVSRALLGCCSSWCSCCCLDVLQWLRCGGIAAYSQPPFYMGLIRILSHCSLGRVLTAARFCPCSVILLRKERRRPLALTRER
jgi:hypothetical protein